MISVILLKMYKIFLEYFNHIAPVIFKPAHSKDKIGHTTGFLKT